LSDVFSPSHEEMNRSTDSLPGKEEDLFDNDKYEGRRRARDDQFHAAYHRTSVWGLRLLALLGAVLIVIYTAHLILPPCWRWIEPARLDHIQALLVGVGSAFGAQSFQNHQTR